MAARLYVGTSGFSYPEWRGNFYPKDLPGDEMLKHYSSAFPTVELNNTFYRFPKAEHVEQWRKNTPRGFQFSIKGHRLITHLKRLKNVEDPLRIQLERIAILKDRRGPLLFQLPPTLRRDLTLLRDFLNALPPMPLAIEFRHESWYNDDVYSVLAEQRAALVIMESDEDEPVLQFVGPLAYLRLHRPAYDAAAMDIWAGRIREQMAGGKDVYAYFTHEEGAPAPEYAGQLAKMLST